MISSSIVKENLEKLAYIPQLRMKAIIDLEKNLFKPETEKNVERENKLIRQVHYAARNSRFYSKFYKDENIEVGHINTINDFRKLPFTTKNDLRTQYPFGILATGIEDMGRYAESTGTTGKPSSSYFSREDWTENNVYVGYRLLEIFSPEDVAVIAAPYELSVPAQDLERIFELIGTTIIACGILNEVCPWDRMLNILKSVQPSVLVCSGTRSLLIAEMACQMGFDPKKDFGVKKILNVAESLNEAKAARIKEIWNAEIYNAYGTTETCALAVSCRCGKTHLLDERYFFEVINPVTGEVLPEGERGELVVTMLVNKSMPLIRYRTGDYVSIMHTKCDCKNTSPILLHYGRIGDEITIGNSRFSFIEIEEIIMGCKGQDKFFEVEYDGTDALITMDLRDSSSLEEVENEIRGKFPVEVRDRIRVRAYDKESREKRLIQIKGSNKPFGSFCFMKK